MNFRPAHHPPPSSSLFVQISLPGFAKDPPPVPAMPEAVREACMPLLADLLLAIVSQEKGNGKEGSPHER